MLIIIHLIDNALRLPVRTLIITPILASPATASALPVWTRIAPIIYIYRLGGDLSRMHLKLRIIFVVDCAHNAFIKPWINALNINGLVI